MDVLDSQPHLKALADQGCSLCPTALPTNSVPYSDFGLWRPAAHHPPGRRTPAALSFLSPGPECGVQTASSSVSVYLRGHHSP